ncbi:MAG: hypothetical protein HY735_04875 [Verrucomicrobia bacterium]|nr:hypothetical protein [Verrucomicrobiota bacterium]
MQFLRSVQAVGATVVLFCAIGCSKSAEKSGPTTFNLKGAAEVTGALESKDYGTALQTLGQIKAALTPEQREEYNKLLRGVKDLLLERMSTDEAAGKAYQALRFLESGR